MDEIINKSRRDGFELGIEFALNLIERQSLFGKHTTSAVRLKWVEDKLKETRAEMDDFQRQVDEARKNGDKLATD